jgi:hypothetical protein
MQQTAKEVQLATVCFYVQADFRRVKIIFCYVGRLPECAENIFYAGKLPNCEDYALLLWPVRGAGQRVSSLGCQPIRGAKTSLEKFEMWC